MIISVYDSSFQFFGASFKCLLPLLRNGEAYVQQGQDPETLL